MSPDERSVVHRPLGDNFVHGPTALTLTLVFAKLSRCPILLSNMEFNAMRFECKSTYYPKPSEPNDFIRSNLIDVCCFTAGDSDTVAARLAVDYLDILRAESEGQSVLHVCDADSSAWSKVYESMIEPATDFAEIRKDFGFR